VVCIDMPIEVCIESINMRRRAKRGENAEPVNPRNTESKLYQTQKAARWLSERGVSVTWGNREQALAKILEILKMEKRDVDRELVPRDADQAPPTRPEVRAETRPCPVAETRAPDLSAR